jgi:hypothetical protein
MSDELLLYYIYVLILQYTRLTVYYIYVLKLLYTRHTTTYICPHTTIYMCLHPTFHWSSYYYAYICPHATIYLSSYDYICVLILLYMRQWGRRLLQARAGVDSICFSLPFCSQGSFGSVVCGLTYSSTLTHM